MKRAYRISIPVLIPFFLLAACAMGNRLTVPGDLSRPEKAAKTPPGAPQVVVLDFGYSAQEPGIVGRDFDQVRPIDWGGKPGRAMADLVAGILAEGGVGVVRAAVDGPALGTALVRVSGQVLRFEVNARRTSTFNVATEGTVTLVVTVSGGSLAAPRDYTVTTRTSLQNLYATSEDARDALFSSANAAAEEAVRDLLGSGMVPAPPSGK